MMQDKNDIIPLGNALASLMSPPAGAAQPVHMARGTD
jgi:hypothetical protein